jgi:flavin reductase (DIM6/NTAB) family NADH-FMN oxidoreductase RutF
MIKLKINKRNKMTTDFSKLQSSEIYKIMSNSIIPRPIAWIVTKDEEGLVNIAPFSYFTGVSSKPPLLMVSIGRKKKDINEPKDTFLNLKTTKKATICLVPQELQEIMDKTGAGLPHSKSEADEFGIELQEIEKDFPPIIKGVKQAFFTTLYGTFENDEMATIPFFLEIKKMFKKEDFNIVARVGKGYGRIC